MKVTVYLNFHGVVPYLCLFFDDRDNIESGSISNQRYQHMII